MVPRCPDCDVEMKETEHKSNYSGDGIRIETGGGFLGDFLDLKGDYLTSYVCPECRLVRFYAETEAHPRNSPPRFSPATPYTES